MDRPQVLYEILKSKLSSYHKTLEMLGEMQFSTIIQENCHKPLVLFKPIEFLIHAPRMVYVEHSQEICKEFLHL